MSRGPQPLHTGISGERPLAQHTEHLKELLILPLFLCISTTVRNYFNTQTFFHLNMGDLGRVKSAWEVFGGASAPTSQICAAPRCFCCLEKSQAEIQFPMRWASKAPHQDLHFTVEDKKKVTEWQSLCRLSCGRPAEFP